MKTTFHVSGMHCSSCDELMKEICQEEDNVTSCTADFNTGKVVVEHDGELNKQAIQLEIESLADHKVTW